MLGTCIECRRPTDMALTDCITTPIAQAYFTLTGGTVGLCERSICIRLAQEQLRDRYVTQLALHADTVELTTLPLDILTAVYDELGSMSYSLHLERSAYSYEHEYDADVNELNVKLDRVWKELTRRPPTYGLLRGPKLQRWTTQLPKDFPQTTIMVWPDGFWQNAAEQQDPEPTRSDDFLTVSISALWDDATIEQFVYDLIAADHKKGQCGFAEVGPHRCPFAMAVHDDYDKWCTCCDSCTAECKRDI